MKKIFFVCFTLFLAGSGFAQQSSKAYQKLADSLFQHQNYQSAATYYEKAIKKSEQPGNIMLDAARCNSKMNRMTEAEQWYKKAKDNHAEFKVQDTYDFAQTSLALNKRSEASATLREHLNIDPNAHQLRKLLGDIEHVEKYYKDSATYSVVSLPINTAEAEFAPAYYKDGIVFSSAQPQHSSKKKYHWDNSNFLNLYYSKSVNDQLQKPELFEKELDSRFHDGPATFYAGYENMIVNRNRPVQATGKKDTWIWHLSLYDAQKSKANGTWKLIALSFDEPPYSLAHPSISEDGNVLYFVSDKPGGYGGTDIYRAKKVNGTWSKPFNLGPTINTPGNEVFPSFNGSVLYFASNGHGGLGGLDIFRSSYTTNGFTAPVNIGFPINSNADDFSFITKGDEQKGYFSSSRNGNDDLFAFYKQAETIKMLAHVYDDVTKESIPGATIKLITSTNEDQEIASDSAGFVHFQLSKESAYVLIGNKDGKTGMITGFALSEEDHLHTTHPVALLGDTTRIACIGTIANEFGQTQDASSISIYDETTGKKIEHSQQKSLVNFLGEKGHSYRVEIQNEQGDVTIHQLSIQPDEGGTKTWNMVLKKSILTLSMAARVFNAENNQPLAGAAVKIITFSEPDREVTANNDGIVEFILTEGTAYVVLGSKDNLTGMHTGVAEQGTEKSLVIHPVPAHGDPVNTLPVVALITDDKGEILSDPIVIVTDKTTGESVPTKIMDGVLSFLGEKEKEYDIKVEANGYQTTLDEVSISKDATVIDKMSLVLAKEITASPVTYLMAARAFKEEDNSPLAGAEVIITTFTEPDKELIAKKDGLIDFSLPEGSAYIILASKDGYYGMYTGVAEKGSDKSTIIHPVSTKLNNGKQVPVMAQVPEALNQQLTEDNLTVTEKSSGKIIPAQISNGILNFYGDTGETYTITIKEQKFDRPIQDITIPVEENQIKKVTLVLGANNSLQQDSKTTPVVTNITTENYLPIVGRITDSNGEVLNNAIVTVIDKATGEKIPSQYKDGLLSFYAEKGKSYSISAEEENHQAKTQEISVPIETSMPGKISITLESNRLTSYEMAARVFKSEDNTALAGANLTITSFNDSDIELIADSLGIADFTLTEGSAYIIFAHKDEYHGMYSGVVEKGTDKSSAIHPVSTTKESENQVPVVAQLTNDKGLELNEQDITITEKSSGEIIPAQVSNGLLSFYGDKGESYTITINDQDNIRTEEVTIEDNATEVQKISLVENEEVKLPSLTMAVRVFRADNQSSLSGADVKIISFSEPDQELITNTDGISDFALPKGTAFVAVGTKDGYTGMYTGIAEMEPEKDEAIYPIPAYAMQENQLQVVGFARSENGKQLTPTQVQVTNKKTGEEVPSRNQNGLLSFVGEKGNTYKIQVSAENHDSFLKEITLDNSSSMVKSFKMSIPGNNVMAVSSTLIILNKDGNTSRFYISSKESHSEILERDGNLYLVNGSTERNLGQGSLAKFQEDPAAYLKETNLSFDNVITLQNIYFDYNKALLDETDKKELDKAKVVLQRYPSLQLTIGAHADDRGDDKYNLNLSKRRAKSVESYLIKKGIMSDNIYIHAYGESTPAIPCSTNCNEDDHQKNRRAEFSLRTTKSTALPMTNDKVKIKSTSRVNSSNNKALLEKYGNKEIEGLFFKVNIGAYRHNRSLTFDNLKDLGTIEKDHVNGITYYYLSSYSTLQSAHDIRQQVVERGVKDAFISIFDNGKKISYTAFVSLVK